MRNAVRRAGQMKLSLNTYNIVKDWELDKIIEISRKLGFAGIEFRAEQNQGHGVEIDKDSQARRKIKEKVQDAYLEIVGVGTSSRFEYSDKNLRRKNIDSAKRHVELAADIGARYVRVFGNLFEPGADKAETVKWVGEALAELREFSKPYKVDTLLEMHGDFNNWNYALKVIEHAGVKNGGLVYNCDPRDVFRNSVNNVYSKVRNSIKHVHMHSFCVNYPYKEILQLLKDDGYDGYVSAEIDECSADAETVLAYYSMLYYEMLSTLK